jgi:hypothetical protein
VETSDEVGLDLARRRNRLHGFYGEFRITLMGRRLRVDRTGICDLGNRDTIIIIDRVLGLRRL